MVKKHPTYKKMIISTIKFLADDDSTVNKFSYDLIRKSMINFFILDATSKKTKLFTKNALATLVEENKLIKTKHSYRFSANFLKNKRKRIRIKKAIKQPKIKSAKKVKSIKKAKKIGKSLTIKKAASP